MSLDVFQQIFSLSVASNLVNDFLGTQTCLQKALQFALTSRALPATGAEWQLVWGPVVWKNKPDVATTGPDNSWYIAFHPSLAFEDGSVHPTYVIAIAGTPAKSQYAWLKKNLAVNSVTDFNAWVACGIENKPVVVPAKDIRLGMPYIATGTVNAVNLLLTTEAPQGAISENTTLLDFITNLDQSTSPRVIATSHSLGGVLSPSLALALVRAEIISSDSTLTYPTARPSPGNKAFATLFSNTFPARKSDGSAGYEGWNLNLVNKLDAIPQAWCPLRSFSPAQNLGNIPSIYGTPELPMMLGVITVISIHTLSSGVLYKPLPSQYFIGSTPIAPPITLGEFMQIALPQHERAYFCEVRITCLSLNQSEVPNCELKEKSRDEKRFNYPLIAEFEWAREHPEEAEKEIEKVEGTPEAKTFLSNEQ
ncbi:hypothetical protein J3R83DRAFT_14003 [Lanmaoa asiatica]|nr:hypothetical protein J3R83DRAFT_14003 [Lanmaoa asiatica]